MEKKERRKRWKRKKEKMEKKERKTEKKEIKMEKKERNKDGKERKKDGKEIKMEKKERRKRWKRKKKCTLNSKSGLCPCTIKLRTGQTGVGTRVKFSRFCDGKRIVRRTHKSRFCFKIDLLLFMQPLNGECKWWITHSVTPEGCCATYSHLIIFWFVCDPGVLCNK